MTPIPYDTSARVSSYFVLPLLHHYLSYDTLCHLKDISYIVQYRLESMNTNGKKYLTMKLMAPVHWRCRRTYDVFSVVAPLSRLSPVSNLQVHYGTSSKLCFVSSFFFTTTFLMTPLWYLQNIQPFLTSLDKQLYNPV